MTTIYIRETSWENLNAKAIKNLWYLSYITAGAKHHKKPADKQKGVRIRLWH